MSSLQQSTPIGPGVVGLAVANAPYQVHLVRVYANPRKITVAPGNWASVIVSALIQNIGPVPLQVRARFQAVGGGTTFAGGSQTTRINPQGAAEFSVGMKLPPVGPFYVVAVADYSPDGGSWFSDPDQGMTDVEVYPSGNVTPPYARDANGGVTTGAIIDYRDNPKAAWMPH